MTLRNQIHRAIAPLIYTDGFALLPGQVHSAWPERQYLRRLLKRLDIDCVFDVGANIGEYATELRLIGFKGLILSFEPDPACFATLRERSAKDQNWHAFNVALGSAPGEMRLNIMANRIFNSFRRPSTDESSAHAEQNLIVDQVSVEVKTLDDVLRKLQSELQFRNIHLKMDTQGFDVEVFRGATRAALFIKSMQSELSVKRIYEGTPRWTDLIAEYEASGFEVSAMYAVNPDRDDLVELDCFLTPRRQRPMQSVTETPLARSYR